MTNKRYYVSRCSKYGSFVNDPKGELPIIEVLHDDAKELCNEFNRLDQKNQRIMKKYNQQKGVLEKTRRENKFLQEEFQNSRREWLESILQLNEEKENYKQLVCDTLQRYYNDTKGKSYALSVMLKYISIELGIELKYD